MKKYWKISYGEIEVEGSIVILLKFTLQEHLLIIHIFWWGGHTAQLVDSCSLTGS